MMNGYPTISLPDMELLSFPKEDLAGVPGDLVLSVLVKQSKRVRPKRDVHRAGTETLESFYRPALPRRQC
jgi:hypothetical protein